MKVTPLIAVALVLCIAFLRPIQAKKKPKNYCVGKDGNRYDVGKGYDSCVQYKCVKEKKKFVMQEGQCVIDDGVWSDWSSWSACTSTCGAATKTRKRTCSNPPPSDDGSPCPGSEEETEECSLPSCGMDLALNVSSLEASVVTLLDMVDKLTARMEAINDVESCLADTTSAKCPAAASGKVSVPGAITALETPTVFSCYNTTEITESQTMAPYGTCQPNVGNVVNKTTGVFTVAKAGKYRLTFMSLMYPENRKKVIATMTKTSGGTEIKLARSLAQSRIGDEQLDITITLDIIAELAVEDTIHVAITLSGSGNSRIPESDHEPYQTFFTGEFISV